MSVKIAIEGRGDEVETALSVMAGVMDLVYVERHAWDLPAPTVRVTVDATMPQSEPARESEG